MTQDVHDMMTQQGEIILYQPDETVRLEVRLEDDTVWLTQAQMAELFQTTKNNITLHISNVYKEKELSTISTSKESLLVQTEGNRQVTRKRNLYNLEHTGSEHTGSVPLCYKKLPLGKLPLGNIELTWGLSPCVSPLVLCI